MNIRVIEKEILSSDGEHALKGKVYIPEGSPAGLFHVVHGMCEYIGRYDGFMRELANEGFIVFGYDHLGHGETAREGELGFIAHKDGWKRLVDDVYVFGKAIRAEYGEDLPFVLMGHSMGSFIVRIAAAEYGMFDKLIVMGTGGPNPAAGIGLAVIKAIKALKGEKHISKIVYSLAFGSYNKKFASENDVFSWLSKDRSVRERYAADKFCNYKFTSSAMGDLVTLNKLSNTKEINSKLVCKKPILLVSGGDDPVGENGAGVKKVCAELKSLGADVEMKIYDNCRHEILNDTCRDEVIKDIIDFVKQK